MTGTGTASRGDSRAQSNPIAIVLVFGLVIASTTIIVVAGGSAISATQNQLGAQNAETKMTQLDSQMATVALGSSASQEVALGTSSNYRVNGSAGRINVTSSTNGTILDTNLGEVVYENDDGERVAYQGGGVWRAGASDGSVMVSPPEFHYQGGTLTLPLVTIANNASFNGNAVITRNHSVQKYPNATLENPLRGGTVTIRITSDYHQGWYTYINSRTEGSVTYVGPRTIEVTLTVPVTAAFEDATGTTADSGDPIDDESDFGGASNTNTGVSAPDADYVIESAIDECDPVASTSCKDLSAEMSDDKIEAGTYYEDGDYDFGSDSEFDTSSGDIEVIVDGEVEFSGTGGPSNEDHSITGGGDVTFYIKDDVDLNGNAGVNNNGDEDDLVMLVHTDADDFDIKGTDTLNGYVYAPGTDLTINGGGAPANNIVGGIVVQTATSTGGGSLAWGGPLSDPLEFDSGATINYLHVSENSVNVTAN